MPERTLHSTRGRLLYTLRMLHHRPTRAAVLVALLSVSAASWSCPLQVRAAWIREPPPGMTTLAGYALLTNTGSSPVTLQELRSALFARIQMHETMLHQGMAMMMPLTSLNITPGATVRFEPDGKHFMLIDPKRVLHAGEQVPIELIDGNGCTTTATFVVSKDAPSN
jgi:periplasmic copper chaperone A